jgi:hypothetical protein
MNRYDMAKGVKEEKEPPIEFTPVQKQKIMEAWSGSLRKTYPPGVWGPVAAITELLNTPGFGDLFHSNTEAFFDDTRDPFTSRERVKEKVKQILKSRQEPQRAENAKVVGQMAHSPQMCSCAMCGNPRKGAFGKGKDRLTMQEKKFASVAE